MFWEYRLLVLSSGQKQVIYLKEQMKVGHTELSRVLFLFVWFFFCLSFLITSIPGPTGTQWCQESVGFGGVIDVKWVSRIWTEQVFLALRHKDNSLSRNKGSFVCPTINSHFLCIKETCTVMSLLASWYFRHTKGFTKIRRMVLLSQAPYTVKRPPPTCPLSL